MKHIGFDQSTVLNEYAKIAQKKGFIKTATDDKLEEFRAKASELGYGIVADESQQPTILGMAQEIIKDMPHSRADQSFKQLVYMYTGRRVTSGTNQAVKTAEDLPAENIRGKIDPHGGQGETKDIGKITQMKSDLDRAGREKFEKALMAYKGLWSIYNQSVKGTKGAKSDLQSAVNEITLKNAMNVLSQKLDISDGAQTAYESLVKALHYVLIPMIPKRIPKKMGPEISFNNADDNFGKEASNKIYDIFGETGNDIINDAHPNGGTKTELTHSKTNENLIETIIEQQERDIDVAKSIPNGTYATLVDLYNQLYKLGYKNKLTKLLNTIKAIATPDDIETHRLITLANKLDREGKKEAADKIDELLRKKDLIKKKAAFPFMLLPILPLAAASYYIYQYATRSSEVLDELINRLQDLDTNPKTKQVVDGWVKTLNDISGRLAFQQTSEDPKVNAANAKKYNAAIQQAHNFVLSLNSQWIKIKPYLDDWGGEYGDIGDVTTALTDAMIQLGKQARLSKTTVAKAIQKGKADIAKGQAGTGPSKEHLSKEDIADANTDIDKKKNKKARIKKFFKLWQTKFNKVMKGTGFYLKPDGIPGIRTKPKYLMWKNKADKSWDKLKEMLLDQKGNAGLGPKKEVNLNTTMEEYSDRINAIAEKLMEKGYEKASTWLNISSAQGDISSQDLRRLRRTLLIYARKMLMEYVPFVQGADFSAIENPNNFYALLNKYENIIRNSNLKKLYK